MTSAESKKKQIETLKACLLSVARDRDKQAFAQLFEHYVPLLRSYSLAREPGADLLADELAQEVMLKIWTKAHTYKPEISNVNTWVYTLARNCRIDYLRRNGRFSTEIDPTEIFESIEDEGPDPFMLAQQQRLETTVQESLMQLPPEQAQVLRKVYVEGKSHTEASEDLGLPLGTVKSRVRLALKKLEVMVRR